MPTAIERRPEGHKALTRDGGRRGALLLRLIRRLPAPLLNRVPAVAWAVLVRVPRSWASGLLERVIPAIYEAVNKAGAAQDDRFMRAFVDPRIEWSPPALFPDAETYRGHAGMRAEVDRFHDAWEGMDQEITSVSVQIPQSTILVSVRFDTRGRGSGIETQWEEFHVLEIERGRVVRLRMFQDSSEAARAAGLRT
jgi:ketosteroid isomerase-like protein